MVMNTSGRTTCANWLDRLSTSSSAVVWAEALESLPPETFKFALNASHDTLSHNANLSLWGKTNAYLGVSDITDTRPQCLYQSTSYEDTMKGTILHQRIKEYLPPSMKSIVDLEDYQFPQHIVHTDLRPDIVCWVEERKMMCSLS